MSEEAPTYQDAAAAQMPMFVSCKLVGALRIKAIAEARQNDEDGAFLHFEDRNFAPRFMSADWIDKRGAKAGGWLVSYADGYLSWSPAAAFENGSVPETLWGLTRMQEPKYTINLRGQLMLRSDRRQLPADEPLFILRAQDMHAVTALAAYRERLPEKSGVQASVDERLLAFSAFRHDHRERMKEPDTKPPRPPGAVGPTHWEPGERERDE